RDVPLCRIREAGDRRPAGDHGDVEAGRLQGGADAAGTRQVTDAEQMLDIEEQPRGGFAHEAICHSRSNSDASWPTLSRWSKVSRTLVSAATPSSRRSSGLRISRSSAAASAAGSSGGTTSPFSPSESSSGTPATAVEAQTRPWLDASTSTLGKPSRSPSAATRQ